MDVDRQRIAAVRALEALGFSYWGGRWLPTTGVTPHIHLTTEADAMHAALVRRADVIAGCLEGSAEQAELRAIIDLVEAYEAKRWPEGKEPGGKG